MSSRQNLKCNKDSQLLECVKSAKPTAEKLIELRRCLERKSNVNATDNDGNTPLHLAVQHGKPIILKLLLRWGADVNKPNLLGYTPLHLAVLCSRSSTSVVKLLLDKGADVNAQTKFLDTPLHEAARYRNVDVMKLLVKNDAKVNIPNKIGQTVLPVAFGKVSDVEFLLLLLSKYTRARAKTKDSSKMLHKAVLFGNVSVLEVLLKKYSFDVNEKDIDGNTLLYKAVKSGNTPIVLLLLNYGADVNKQCASKYTALHLAALLGNTYIVELLLNKNADVNAVGRNDFTPLHEAVRQRTTATVELLLNNNADVNAKTRNDHTPLHLAVYYNNVNVVNLLLRRGADVTLSNRSGFTSLHLAACFGKSLDLNSKMRYDKVFDMFNMQGPNKLPFLKSKHFMERLCEEDMNGFYKYDLPVAKSFEKRRCKCYFRGDALFGEPVHCARSKNNCDVNKKDDNRNRPRLYDDAENVSILEQLLNVTDVNVQDREGRTPLHKAAFYGNVSAIELLLNNGAKVNARSTEGYTPLHEAALSGQVSVAVLFVKKKADVTAQTIEGNTPLHSAADSGNKSIAEELLNEGALVNVENKSGLTPLHKAARSGNTSLVKLLLKEGAKVNACTKFDDTPLHEAVLSRNPSVIKLLLDESAEINALNIKAITPLHIALKSRVIDVVTLLLNKGADVNTKDEEGATPLFEAVKSKNTFVLKLLLDKNVDVNVQNKLGKTALFEAVKTEDTSVVELLLSTDPDMNVKDEEGNTPLTEAIRSGNASIIKLLLNKNPEVNMKNAQGNTPLFEAVKSGNTSVVELLVKKTPNVDVKNGQGNTLLLEAVRSENISIIEMLLQQNPDVNAKDKLGNTVLVEAVRLRNTAVVALLIEKSIDVDVKDEDGRTLLHKVASSDHDAIAMLLLKQGANINERDKFGETPLHTAAEKGRKSCVMLLLSKNADVNAQKSDGETPLHSAMHAREYDVVNLLLKNGADINAQDRIGDTPLHKLVKRGFEFDTERVGKVEVYHKEKMPSRSTLKKIYSKDIYVAELLLKKGCDVNARNNQGKTPLHEAACYGRTSIARLLLEKNVDVNAQTVDGETPLHLAVRHENVALITLLLNSKTDVLLRNNTGDTPFTHALLFFFEGNKKILSLLQTAEKEALKCVPQTTLNASRDINQDKTSYNGLQSEKLMYLKTNDTSGLPGQLYETKMVSLVLIRMLNNKYLEHDFFLGVNIDSTGAIDDICLRYRLTNKLKPTVLFTQAKHKEKSNVKVTEKDLWNDSGDFSIPKYFKSYLMIKERFQVGSEDAVFEGDFNDVDCYLILYTPANENFAKKKTDNDISKIVDDLINTSYTAKPFQYDFDETDIDRLVTKVIGDARMNFEKESDANMNLIEYARIQAKDFFSSLWFFIGQAKEDKVERLVKYEIRKHYNLENNLNNYSFELHSNVIFLRAHDRVQKWWMSKDKGYLRRSDDFFKLAKLACLADVFLTGVCALNSLKICVNLELNHYLRLNTSQNNRDNFIVKSDDFNAILRSLLTLINTENILISVNTDLKNKIYNLLLTNDGTESLSVIRNNIYESSPQNAISINEKFEYSKRDGTSEVGGALFRTKLLSLVLLRVLNHELIEQDPLLGTKIHGISGMNDICLRYQVKHQERPVVLFVQLVHRDNIEKRILTDEALLNESEDFYLKKYFNAYLTIKDKFQRGNRDLMFEGEFNEVDCHFILYTSAKESVKKKKTLNKNVIIQNLIDTNKTKEPFQYFYDEADIVNFGKITAMDRIEALGTVFLDFVLSNKYNPNVLSNKLLARYHVAVVREILQQCKTQPAINKYRMWEFRSEFFNSNLEHLVTFRKVFAKILSSKNRDQIKNINAEQVISDYVRNKLESMEIKLPLAFGNLDMTFRGSDDKVRNRIKALADNVVRLLERNKKTKIIEINDDDVGPGKNIEQGIIDINGGIGGAVGNLLVLDPVTNMLRFDLENDKLLYNAASFLAELKNERYKPFNEYLSAYRIKINTSEFPKCSFTVDENDTAHAKDFLNKLWLYPNQAKEDKVERILKYEINDKYYSKIPNNHNRNTHVSDFISLQCLDEIQKWWLQLNKSPYLSRASELFERAELADIYNLLQTVINYMYISNIYSIDIKVKHIDKNKESDQMHELFKKIVVKMFKLFDPQFDEHFVLRRNEFEISERSTLSLRIHPQMEWVALTVTRRKTSKSDNIDMKHCFVAKAGPRSGNRQARDGFMLRQLYSTERVFRFKDCLKNTNIEFLIRDTPDKIF